MTAATKKQVQCLRILARKMFSNDEYYEWLKIEFGVEHTRGLSRQDASLAIERLSGERKSRSYYGRGKRGGSAATPLTPGQAAKIGMLEKLLGWDDNPQRMLGFLKKQTGKDKDVQMLLKYEATKVIIGMQKVLAANDLKLYKLLNSIKPGEIDLPVNKALRAVIEKRTGAKHDQT